MSTPAQEEPQQRIETRISLVLYGGVSLAVYMSGACQELLSVVRATSQEVEDSQLTSVEKEYRRIGRNGGCDGRPRRVVVDVLAGSSAGGLNALFLGKALAHGGSLDSLRRVWHQQADLLDLMGLDDRDDNRPDADSNETGDFRRALLDGERFHLILHQALKDLTSQGSAGGVRLVDDVDCYVTTTDLRGVAETVRLDTTGAMQIQELRRRGVFHFSDRRSSRFAPDARNQLDGDHDAVLAFAGRATAAHPAAFYPAQWNQVESSREDADNRAPELHEFLSPRLHPDGGSLDLRQRWYSDGGAMDNKPFKYALAPLRNRRAEVPVDRKVVFIEPDPVAELDDWHRTTPPPLWNYTGGTYGLARAENIREDIAELAARNDAIASLNSALVGLFDRDIDEVRASLRSRLPADHPEPGDDTELAVAVLDRSYYRPVEPDPADHNDGSEAEATGPGVVDLWLNQTREEFGEERGWGAVVLEDYRWRTMVSQLVQSALTVGESPADQALVAELAGPVEERLRIWMEGDDPDKPFPNPVRRGLKLLDVDYRLRRFTLIEHLLSYEQQKLLGPDPECEDPGRRFAQCVQLRRAINELYAELNNYLEDRRSELIINHRNLTDDELLEFIGSVEMNRQIERTVDDLDDPLRRSSRDGRRAILGHSDQPDGQNPVTDDAGQWVPALDPDLLVRLADAWINFGDYDQLILPLADIAANKFGAVDAVRISPLDATGLVDETVAEVAEDRSVGVGAGPRPGPGRRKLGGNALAHFGGFIDADWRLNDITWGRFDTAEVLVRQILNGDEDDVTAIHDAMLAELANEVVEARRLHQSRGEPGAPDKAGDRDKAGAPDKAGDQDKAGAPDKAGAERSPLDALLAVNARSESELHRSALGALDRLRSCPLDDDGAVSLAIDTATEQFGLLLRGGSGEAGPADGRSDSAPADAVGRPWSVDLSATPERRISKKLALNQGATLLGKAVALSDDRGRPSRVVAGWLTSASLRLALPRTTMEKFVRHGLPVALLVGGAALLVLAVTRQPAGAVLAVAAIAASFYAVYARARAFGARHNGALWRGIGAGAFLGSAIGLVAATVFGAGSAGMATLAVVLAAVGLVMWASLRALERLIQQAGHPKPPSVGGAYG